MASLLEAISTLEMPLTALAVLGRADRAALAALLGRDLADYELVGLMNDPAVRPENGQLSLAPEAAAKRLKALERDDLPAYISWHQQALRFLADKLSRGDQASEPTLLVVFERLANRWLADDPQAFIKLVEGIGALPLQTAAGLQRRRYFEGVALCKAENYSEAIDIFEGLLAKPELEAEVRGRALNSRAICHRFTGRPEDALAGYQRSLAIWQQLGDRLNEGKVRLNMGIIAYELQRYGEAEENLLQAAAIFAEMGSTQWFAVAQNELGLVCRDQGKWEEALAYFEQFMAGRRAENARDHVGLGLLNTGEVLLFQGRLAEALVRLQGALAEMTTRVYQVDIYLNLGLAYQAVGDLAQAEGVLRRALDLALEIGRRDILPHLHYRLGDVLRRRGDDAAALAQFQAGAAVIEATREPLRDEGLKISLLGRWQQVYEALVLHYLALNRPVEAFEWAERARARAFADLVTSAESREVASDWNVPAAKSSKGGTSPKGEGGLQSGESLSIQGMDSRGLRHSGLPLWPGQKQTLKLYWNVPEGGWQGAKPLKQDYSVSLIGRQVSGQDITLLTEAIGPDMYPTSRWQEGQLLAEAYTFAFPFAAPPGEYDLIARVEETGSRGAGGRGNSWKEVVLGQVTLLEPARLFDLPLNTEYPLAIEPFAAQLGPAIQLAAYRLTSGDNYIDLTLYWFAARTPADDYTVFVHLTDADDNIVAQRDTVPAAGQRPTTTWLPTEFIADRYHISLPPGEYTLWLGMYDPLSGERLPAVSHSGPTSENRIQLATLRIPD